MDPTPQVDAELPGVDTYFDAKPTGMEVDSDYVPQEYTGADGLRWQDQEVVLTEAPSAKPSTQQSTELIVETQAASPKKGMVARNVRIRKQPENYVPSMKGNS